MRTFPRPLWPCLALPLLAALPATPAHAQRSPSSAPRPPATTQPASPASPASPAPPASPARPPPRPAQGAQQPRTPAQTAAAASADRGQALYDAGKYEEALIAFRKADEQFRAPTVLLMMARAHLKLGHLREARTHYQRVLEEKLADYAPQAFFDAQTAADKELDALLPRIPTIQIKITGAAPGEAQVFIDGKPAPHDVPVLHDPGNHAITAWAPGRTPTTQMVDLREGKTTQLTLVLQPGTQPAAQPGAQPGAPIASAPQPPAEPSPPPAEPPSTRRFLVPTTVLFAASAVGIGAGAITGAMAADRVGQLKSTCPSGSCYDDASATYDAAQTLTTVSTVSFLLGGAAAAAGLGLLIWDMQRPSPTTQTGLQVTAGLGFASVKGTF
ncbi:hypothetical protein [Chondromyces crocatus]|uniref:PEGA domain-containing protein n=1 Tax=Chondromyces crocatus TaxID=52 RepID=A0A0K1E922_CHOCO|nr:hypothetical protein [Chondromyces crocatus]AKT37386.1 uncharacterized protein CMC5_015220 [Chondromyces crocatus]